jgi:outer membrane protein
MFLSKFKNLLCLSLFLFLVADSHAADHKDEKKAISYDDYVAAIEKSLPEIRSNELDVASAENSLKSAKSAGDTSITGSGSLFSNKEYYTANDKGNLDGYSYSAGLSKTLVSTGTTVNGTYNYGKNRYSNFDTSARNYSTNEPSVTLKLTQPLLYNFLGRVDRYSENNAKMKLEIARCQLQEDNKSLLNTYRKLYFQWVMYSQYIMNLDEAINNSNILKEQIRRKVASGLADNDDYQGAQYSVLAYENQRREYQSLLKNIESRLALYIDISRGLPDMSFFEQYSKKAQAASLPEVGFGNTTSAKIMNLTIKNYAYSKGVYENRLLPQLDVYTGITRKSISESQTCGMSDSDYTIGFEFRYSLENNSAESALKDVEIQIRSLEYEYRSAENSYRKNILEYIENSDMIISQLGNKEKTLKTLESKLVTEKRKYTQARLNLSYVIDTENSITTEKNNMVSLRYQLIGNYLDYMDITK